MPLVLDAVAVAGLAGFLERPIVIVDVGCRWGFADTWRPLGRRATIIGFDPDAEECDRLARAADGSQDVRYVPLALGASPGPAALHLTAEPACSSLFPPDEEVIRRRPELAVVRPTGATSIELETLDRWAARSGIDSVDFVKLDVQGAELLVLQGGEQLLARVRLLEIEVTFNPIYRGQPLFGDVDAFLRARGFVLWRLGNLVHYGLAGTSSDFVIPDVAYSDSRPAPHPTGGGQLSWGHAYYVASDLAFGPDRRPWRDAIRDACLAALLGFRDLAGDALVRGLPDAPDPVAHAIRAVLAEG